MGVFISNAITDRGRILLGEAQVGATFEATRIVMGSGYIPAGYTARTMTAVVAPVIELAINKKKRAGDGTVTFGGVYSNENITEAFYFREFALYARVEYADGTYSDEALYSYGNAGDNADLMPAYSTSTVVEKQMDLVTWVGNDTVVNLSVTSGVYSPHAEKHAADGEDPLTPAMIGALPIEGGMLKGRLWFGNGTHNGVGSAASNEHALHLGAFREPGNAASPYTNLIIDNDENTPISKRLRVSFDAMDSDTSLRTFDVLHTGIEDLPGVIGGLVDYDLIGNAADFDILEWASSQKYSGTFMVGNNSSGLPRNSVFQGLLCVAQSDKFMLIWDATGAYFIATNTTQFTNGWKEIPTTDKNIVLKVPTNRGYRIYNTDTGTASDFMAGSGYSVMRIMDTFDDNNNYRELMLVGANQSPSAANAVRLLDVVNGQGVAYDLYHTGNAPAVIATAELV